MERQAGGPNDAMLVAVRHSCWGNLELIAFCGRLSPEQLAWTTPGTYGDVAGTLRHIVSADQGYLLALTGTLPGEPRVDPARSIALPDLASKERAVLDAAERMLGQPFEVGRRIERPRTTATAGVILAQLVHHGTDHRSQIATILSAHGIEPPDLQVWTYGTSIGQVETK